MLARWASDRAASAPFLHPVLPLTTPDKTSARVIEIVAKNLRQLGKTYQAKQYGNMIANISLAASYLNIMTLVTHSFSLSHHLLLTSPSKGVVDVPKDAEFPEKVDECLKLYALPAIPSPCTILPFSQFELAAAVVWSSQASQHLVGRISSPTLLRPGHLSNPFIPNMPSPSVTLRKKPFRSGKCHMVAFSVSHFFSHLNSSFSLLET